MTTATKSQKDYDAMLKLLLIGNSGVGKSCILMQFSQGKFTNNFYNTIGVDYKVKYLEIEGKKIKLQIWDTAGQDRFKTITSSYYRGAHGIIIVYDVTDKDSFEGVKNWLGQIDKYSDQKVFKFLVGNKSDLAQRRQISYEQGRRYAQKLKVPFFQTSAKLAQNISLIFNEVTRTILSTSDIKLLKPSNGSQNVQNLLAEKEKHKSNGTCC